MLISMASQDRVSRLKMWVTLARKKRHFFTRHMQMHVESEKMASLIVSSVATRLAAVSVFR